MNYQSAIPYYPIDFFSTSELLICLKQFRFYL